MQKKLSLFVLILMITKCAYAQEHLEAGEYYELPKNKKKPRVVNLSNMNTSKTKLYVGIEGGYKFAKATLSNTIDDLLSFQNNGNFYYSMLLGYNFDDKWGLETGYFNNNYGLTLLVGSGRGVAVVQSEVKLQTIPLRYRYKVFTLDKATKTSGIWLIGGVLLSPNAKNRTVEEFSLYANQRKLEGGQYVIDTLSIIGKTRLAKQAVAQLELGIEFQGRISDFLTVSLQAKEFIATKPILNSNIDYAINSVVQNSAIHALKPHNFLFNVLFRYEFARMLKYHVRE